ncbi:MAG: adenylosuccinate synthetase, partial [bacterium]
EIFNIDVIVDSYMEYAKVFKDQITDTDTFLRNALGNKKILLEGAQGAGLSIDHGTYPYVTSSDCTIGGLTKGVGLKQEDVDLTLGIVKAPYMTRVGEGSFPTEFGGTRSAEWCGTKGITRSVEKEKFPNVSVNETDEYLQGIGIRKAGDEYGATTGRPRRTGWLDLPFLRYTTQFGSKDLILTKLDVLDECENILICNSYVYDGPDYNLGNEVLTKGKEIKVTIVDEEIMKYCKPVYTAFKGWLRSIRQIRDENEFPEELKKIISFIETEVSAKTRIVSVGPDRNETIILN